MIIGIDHGYGFTKTHNCTFASGVARFDNEPGVKERVLEYGGGYYTVGCMPDGIVANKTINDDYYILTLAAIAEELIHRKITCANVTLAAGLPLTRFGNEKSSFKDYLLREKAKPIEYKYQGKKFNIRIEDVDLYPQGYAAIIPYLDKIDGPCFIVDIGTGTMDLVAIGSDHVPDMRTAKTMQHGISTCISLVNEEINRVFSSDMLASQIIDIIQQKKVATSPKAYSICESTIKAFANSTLNILRQNKVNYELIPTFVLGGGATLLKNFADVDIEATCIRYITDINANATGYEYLSTIKRKKDY